MLSALGLLALGATLAVHVEEVGDVPPAQAAQILAALSASIEDHAGFDVVIDEDRGGCLAGQPCAAAIRSRTSALDLVLVRLIGGPLRVRVAIEHLRAEAAVGRTGEADVPREGGDVAERMRSLVIATLPRRAPEPLALDRPLPEVAPIERASPWLALSLVGVGVASAATGVVLGLGSQGALDDLRAGAGPADEVQGLTDRSRTQATVANVLFVVAAAALGGGVVAWLAD